jgi:hydrogenase maturation protein HypF
LRLKLNITGIVQGVGFRPFVYRIALKNGLTGYVLNRGDAGVEILVEGPKANIDAFLNDLQKQKPPLAQIQEIIKTILKEKKEYNKFTINKSTSKAELSGSTIPPDIAICNECLKELRDPNDPRYEYFFITCTNCGPRFTILEKLSYDRENTTMHEFPLCGFCQKEYNDPSNRRFHAQTIACPECGPKAYLTTSKGESITSKDPVKEAGKLLSEGYILAVKGYGGFHIASSTTNEKPLKALRAVKHRKAKPFAIMARNLEAIRSFATVNPKEEELLTSFQHPIVLLNKNETYNLSELVAPDLHNIGVMLPYTGMHHMLFDKITDKAFVMTSANPPNQPIVKDNEDALTTLSGTVDYFLFHNRKIAHRCDDTVTRVHDKTNVFIRRSRGYAPAPIILNQKAKHGIIGLGGELNNTSCILTDNKAFISQHIGDVENVETKYFLKEATNHLIQLTNSKIDTIACDLHPKFTTTTLAKEIAQENDWNIIQVQHHHAHVAALMAEHSISEMIGIACDGYGYGINGEAWGGEILLCENGKTEFKRLTHLEPQPLPGGDIATRYPIRIAAAILNKNTDIDPWILANAHHLKFGKTEANLLLHQLKNNKNLPTTTSCGRILDAAAAILDICYERTYEGEPAMKLESTAINGKPTLKVKSTRNTNSIETTNLLQALYENKDKLSKSDLAYSVHAYLAENLAESAIEQAKETGYKNIGFTGGAACNQLLSQIMRKKIEASGLKFIVHETVPPGDGGISFGQAVVGGFSE